MSCRAATKQEHLNDDCSHGARCSECSLCSYHCDCPRCRVCAVIMPTNGNTVCSQRCAEEY